MLRCDKKLWLSVQVLEAIYYMQWGVSRLTYAYHGAPSYACVSSKILSGTFGIRFKVWYLVSKPFAA